MTETTQALKRTALHAQHEALGANFTDFGGWDMPLKYGSELAEHKAVRSTRRPVRPVPHGAEREN